MFFVYSDHYKCVLILGRETCFPQLIDHNRYDNWATSGSKTMLDGANELVKRILSIHEVPSLFPEVTNEMNKILQRAKEKLNKKEP